jgi:hypothetical protein
MRSIVGATPNTENTENTYPRRLYYNEQRGGYAEYLLTTATRERQPGENERRAVVPGLVALTLCKKIHEQ